MLRKKYSNKRLEKHIIVKRILVVVIVLGDLIILPWLLKFPFFLINGDIINAPSNWLSYGFVNSYKDLFTEKLFRSAYLIFQLPVLYLIISILWDADRMKKKNRIKDGIGGPDPSGSGQHGTSRWQNKFEMDNTCNVWYTSDPLRKAGTIFGMEKSKNGTEKVWYNNDDLHVLLIAATRSGKSRKIFMPTIWTMAETEESMVIADPKGELYISTKEWLKNKGYNIIALNFREPAKGNQWNILYPAIKAVKDGDIPKAVECAWNIATSFVNKENAQTTEPIWINGSQSVIASLIISTILDADFEFQKHMATVYYLISELAQELKDGTIPINDYIDKLPRRHPAKAAFAGARIAAAKTRASFFASVLSELRLFTDPNIQDMTCKQDHDMEQIGIKKTAVFLIIPDENSTRNVLATLYIDQLYQSLVGLANRSGGRIPKRVNFLIDEFGNIPSIPDFDKKLTVAGGRGMRFTLAVQDLAQIKKLYKDNSNTITGNCHIWIYLKTKDIDTSKKISEMTGKYTVATDNISSTVQSKGHSSTFGEGLTGRPLLTDDEVRRWNIEESLVFPMSYFPARYPLPDLSFWKANEDYGFVRTGDIDKDKELNLKIIEERWNTVPQREIQKEVPIWIPDLDADYEQEIIPLTVSRKLAAPTIENNSSLNEEKASLENEENASLVNSDIDSFLKAESLSKKADNKDGNDEIDFI